MIAPEEREQKIRDFLTAYAGLLSQPERSFRISALTGEGTRALTFAIMEHLEKSPRPDDAGGTEQR